MKLPTIPNRPDLDPYLIAIEKHLKINPKNSTISYQIQEGFQSKKLSFCLIFESLNSNQPINSKNNLYFSDNQKNWIFTKPPFLADTPQNSFQNHLIWLLNYKSRFVL